MNNYNLGTTITEKQIQFAKSNNGGTNAIRNCNNRPANAIRQQQ